MKSLQIYNPASQSTTIIRNRVLGIQNLVSFEKMANLGNFRMPEKC